MRRIYDRLKPKLLPRRRCRFINFRVNINGAWCRHSIYMNTMCTLLSLVRSQYFPQRIRMACRTCQLDITASNTEAHQHCQDSSKARPTSREKKENDMRRRERTMWNHIRTTKRHEFPSVWMKRQRTRSHIVSFVYYNRFYYFIKWYASEQSNIVLWYGRCDNTAQQRCVVGFVIHTQCAPATAAEC